MTYSHRASLGFSSWINLAIVVTTALVGFCLLVSALITTSYVTAVSNITEDMPVDSFMVSPHNEDGEAVPVTPGLAQYIRAEVASITGVALFRDFGPHSTMTYSLTKDGVTTRSEKILLQSVEGSYFQLRHLEFWEGRPFDSADTDPVAVVGYALAQRKQYQIGSMVSNPGLIGSYKVVGILMPNPSEVVHVSSGDLNHEQPIFDETVFVPFDSPPVFCNPLTREIDQYAETHNKSQERIALYIAAKPGCELGQAIDAVRNAVRDYTGLEVGIRSGTPVRQIHEFMAKATRGSLAQVTMLVTIVGLLSISGLIVMHTFLNARDIGLRRALGATRDRMTIDFFSRYLKLSLLGAVIALVLSAATLPAIASYLGTSMNYFGSKLIYDFIAISLVGPLCSLWPAGLATKASPLDSIQDRHSWGLGKRRVDLRHIFVSVAFGASIGAVFLVSALGLSTVEKIEMYMRSVGIDTVIVAEPPLGSVAPPPKLTYADYEALCTECLAPYGSIAWMSYAPAPAYVDENIKLRVSLYAVAGEVLRSRAYALAAGRWLEGAGEIVVGATLAERLYGEVPPLGMSIRLGETGSEYTIVGVLKQRPKSIADIEHDRNMTAFVAESDRSKVTTAAISEPKLFFRAHVPQGVDAAEKMINSLLKEANPLAASLVVSKPIDDLQSSLKLQATFGLCVSAISFVSVLAACIAVAALTLVQTKEMERILALHRACGATAKRIMAMVLTEVLTLVLAASALGLSLAYACYYVLSRLDAMPMVANFWYVIAAWVMSVAVATLAAYLPAKHTAAQAPASLF